MEALLSVQMFFLERPNLPNSTIKIDFVSCVHARHFVPGSLCHFDTDYMNLSYLCCCLFVSPIDLLPTTTKWESMRCAASPGVSKDYTRCLQESWRGLPQPRCPTSASKCDQLNWHNWGISPQFPFCSLFIGTQKHTHTDTHFKLISNLNLNLSLRLPLPFKWTNCFFYHCNLIVTTAVMAPSLDRQAGQDITNHIATNQCKTVPVPFTVTGCVV